MAIGEIGLPASIDKSVSAAQRLKTFLSHYFYFTMSLLMSALVVRGLRRTMLPQRAPFSC